MNSYEAVFILRPELNKESLDKTLGQIQETISKYKGVSDQVKEWGKQKLAYSVKKCKEGVYYVINFHSETGSITKMKKIFGLNDSILRVLITRV